MAFFCSALFKVLPTSTSYLAPVITFGPYNVLRTLLIIALVYYAIRWWMRVRQQQANGSQQQPDGRGRKEGSVTVESIRQEGKRPLGDTDGEYVDFEEVD